MFLRLESSVVNLAHVVWIEIIKEDRLFLHLSTGTPIFVTDSEAENVIRQIEGKKFSNRIIDIRDRDIEP